MYDILLVSWYYFFPISRITQSIKAEKKLDMELKKFLSDFRAGRTGIFEAIWDLVEYITKITITINKLVVLGMKFFTSDNGGDIGVKADCLTKDLVL